MTAVDTPLIDVNDPRFYDDPWDAYRWMRDHSRVHWDAGNDLWVVSRHEDVSLVSRQATRYSAAGRVRPAVAAPMTAMAWGCFESGVGFDMGRGGSRNSAGGTTRRAAPGPVVPYARRALSSAVRAPGS